jgi:predicted GIY-YIG superfamily endonuclease
MHAYSLDNYLRIFCVAVRKITGFIFARATHFVATTARDKRQTLRQMPEHFCYLLRSETRPKKGYIGYALSPLARLEQHNGTRTGGAAPTRMNRPWEIVVVVGGFASRCDALCFEYAWQHPRTPVRTMAHVLRLKGLWKMKGAYAQLRALTKNLASGDSMPAWSLRVLEIMMGMPAWEHVHMCVL